MTGPHRSITAALALSALALCGCGSADESEPDAGPGVGCPDRLDLSAVRLDVANRVTEAELAEHPGLTMYVRTRDEASYIARVTTADLKRAGLPLAVPDSEAGYLVIVSDAILPRQSASTLRTAGSASPLPQQASAEDNYEVTIADASDGRVVTDLRRRLPDPCVTP